jgi:AmmeMemoRadiSam system protein B
MIREPAVAGQFYPGNARQIEAELDALLQPAGPKRDALAVVVPHAGWMYSGRTAGILYSQVNIPDRVIMLGPNHHGIGSRYALFDAGRWRTPAGDARVAEPLAAALLANCELLAADLRAHALEHCLEVQVPMLLRENPAAQIVPLLIGNGEPAEWRAISAAIAATVREYGKPVLLLASSDLNHYADQQTSNRKDRLALDAVVALNEDRLLQVVNDEDISMCGVVPTYIVLVAAKQLGARRAEVLDYRTSGDVSGDYSAVVGYGAVAIW